MKKRLSLSAVLCALMIATSACSQPQTPYEVYSQALQHSQQATSSAMHLVYEVDIAMDGNTAHARMEGDVQQVRISETEAGVAAWLQTDTPGIALESATYFRDGVLYQEAAGRRVKMDAELDQVLYQLEAVGFLFAEPDVLEAEMEEIADSTDRKLTFTLSGESMWYTLWQVSQSIFQSMGLPQDEDGAVTSQFSDIAYSLVVDEEQRMKSSDMAFSLEMTQEEETVSITIQILLDDIALNTLTEIDYPDDLDSYGSMLDVLQEELDKLNEELAEQSDPTYRPLPSAYTVVNEFGDDCNAAALLAEEGEQLDYFFWLLNQTQVGLTGAVPATGFADASGITTEGLLRLFCLANQDRFDEFADLEEGTFHIPDGLPPLFLNGVLGEGYVYDPSTLPEEFGYADGALTFPIALCQPAPNPCRVDRVEVLDAQRLQITATGMDLDRETPLNTQQVVLFVPQAGQVVFESYRIEVL